MKKKDTMPEKDWQQTHEKSGGGSCVSAYL